MRIALIGTRGVPAGYGGFETCAEELGGRLVCRGHEVTVYCRSGYYREKRASYLGMRLVYLHEFSARTLETMFSSLQALLHALSRDYDILFVFNTANSPWLFLPAIMGKRTVLHVDGLEWKRSKWSAAGKAYFKLAERLGVKTPAALISDSREIQKYYLKTYGRNTHYISYGADIQHSRDRSLLDPFSLEPGGYFLQITRFEPENNPLLTVQAFENLETDKKLVLVGGTRYRTDYLQNIKKHRNSQILFPGFIYDKEVRRELLCNCFAYLHGNEVGGTNPALLEAMASGCFVISRDVPFNREVLGAAGIYYRKNPSDLQSKLKWTLENADILEANRKAARSIICERYNWEAVTSEYESLFRSIRKKDRIRLT